MERMSRQAMTASTIAIAQTITLNGRPARSFSPAMRNRWPMVRPATIALAMINEGTQLFMVTVACAQAMPHTRERRLL